MGHPINQEDLLETLLTFTEIVFEVFDRTGVVYTRGGRTTTSMRGRSSATTWVSGPTSCR